MNKFIGFVLICMFTMSAGVVSANTDPAQTVDVELSDFDIGDYTAPFVVASYESCTQAANSNFSTIDVGIPLEGLLTLSIVKIAQPDNDYIEFEYRQSNETNAKNLDYTSRPSNKLRRARDGLMHSM